MLHDKVARLSCMCDTGLRRVKWSNYSRWRFLADNLHWWRLVRRRYWASTDRL